MVLHVKVTLILILVSKYTLAGIVYEWENTGGEPAIMHILTDPERQIVPSAIKKKKKKDFHFVSYLIALSPVYADFKQSHKIIIDLDFYDLFYDSRFVEHHRTRFS